MSSIFNYIKKNTERRTAGPGSLEKRSARSIERRTEASEKRSVAIEKRSGAAEPVERRSGLGFLKILRDMYRDYLLDLENVVIVKPSRGGPALFRMLYYSLKENVSFKVLKVEFAKGRSFYLFPDNVFDKFEIPLAGWYQGRIVIIHVEKGSLAVSREFVKEINVEVKSVKEKGPWGEYSIKRIYVNGKQVVPGPSPEQHSGLEDRQNDVPESTR